MLATFNDTWDWTAIGTLTLAAVTLLLAGATFWMVVLARRSLAQTKDEIALSRREVEEAHRPVLVPLADSRSLHSTEGPAAARPTVPGAGQLRVPIENIGTGPALRVEASVQMLNPDGGPTGVGTGGMEPGVVAGIRASSSLPVIVKIGGLADVPGFWLTLTYEDVAGKGWITKARYIPTGARYEDVTINTLEEGAYGLRRDSELVKSAS